MAVLTISPDITIGSGVTITQLLTPMTLDYLVVAGGSGNQTGHGADSGTSGAGTVIIQYPDIYELPDSTTGSPTIVVSGGYRIYKFTTSGRITF